jgi:hypothetical protein
MSSSIFTYSNYLLVRIAFFIHLLLLLPFDSFGGNAEDYPYLPSPWRAEYNILLKDFVFTHPMTVINQQEVSIVRIRIASDLEPQKTAYARLLQHANASLTFVPDPPPTMNIMGGYEPNSNLDTMRVWLWRNCHAAYSSALAYMYSSNSIYAEKAVEILMAWANMNTTFTGGDRSLQLGSFFSPMLYAADILYDFHGWAEQDKFKFKSWWRTNVLVHTTDAMRRKDNNWKDAGILGVLAAGVVLEDTTVFKEGLIQLKSYFFERTDENVEIPGLWKIKKDSNGVYLPREVIRSDGSSGITYTAYALTTMTQCFEIARYSGFNFWQDKTTEGASIHELIEFYFNWNILKQTFPWHMDPATSPKRHNVYELANNHFTLNKPMVSWIESHRPLNGEQGDEYITLNKGDLFKGNPLYVQQPNDLPATYDLSQNYPNPFNSSTSISFFLGTTEKASLKVYNVLGKEVATIAAGVFNAGELNTFNFNASQLTSGVYFYRLVSNAKVEARKMILLK